MIIMIKDLLHFDFKKLTAIMKSYNLKHACVYVDKGYALLCYQCYDSSSVSSLSAAMLAPRGLLLYNTLGRSTFFK